MNRQSESILDISSPSDAAHLRSGCEPGNSSSGSDFSTNQPATTDDAPVAFYRREYVLSWLNENVPDKRLKHILRVEEMSVELAKLYGLDAERAAQAGLMHDLAKFFKPKRLLQMATVEGLELDPVDVANPHLLHAEVGAIVARDEFGVQDEAVLDAIRNHTLGCPKMSLLSCVVYLADSLEWGRGDTPELEELRHISRQDLHRAVWLTSEYTLKFLLATPNLIHPRTVLTRNWAMQVATQTNKVYKE